MLYNIRTLILIYHKFLKEVRNFVRANVQLDFYRYDLKLTLIISRVKDKKTASIIMAN